MKYARGGMTSLDYLIEIQRLESDVAKLTVENEKLLNKIAKIQFELDDVVSEWISVKDRLPEKDGFYLAWYTFKGNGHTRDIFYYNCDAPMPSAITHWMPLPTPPPKENEDV